MRNVGVSAVRLLETLLYFEKLSQIAEPDSVQRVYYDDAVKDATANQFVSADRWSKRTYKMRIQTMLLLVSAESLLLELNG